MPTGNGVREHDDHAHHHAQLSLDVEDAREDQSDALHLPGHIGERHKYGAHQRDHAGGLRVVAFADKIGYGVLAKLAQVRRQQQREQHVASGPAHEIHRAVLAHERHEAGHGDERGCAHPAGRRGHAVGHRADAAASHVKLAGCPRPRPPADADIQREGQADDDEGPDFFRVHRGE